MSALLYLTVYAPDALPTTVGEATSLSLGSGASGGIFSPSLFMGAVLGAAFALITSKAVPGLSLDPVNTAVIGMAAMVAGATGAVITATVMIFEMTRDYYVIVPLMAVVSVTYGVRRLFLTDSIYTMKLTRRGHYLPDSLQTPVFMLRTAGDALSVPMVRINDGEMPKVARRRFRGPNRPPHLLMQKENRIFGVVSSEDIEREQLLGRSVADLRNHMRSNFVVASRDEMLFDVVGKMRAADSDLVVVTRDGSTDNMDDVIGVLTWGDIVRLSNLPAPLVVRRGPRNRDGDPGPPEGP